MGVHRWSTPWRGVYAAVGNMRLSIHKPASIRLRSSLSVTPLLIQQLLIQQNSRLEHQYALSLRLHEHIRQPCREWIQLASSVTRTGLCSDRSMHIYIFYLAVSEKFAFSMIWSTFSSDFLSSDLYVCSRTISFENFVRENLPHIRIHFHSHNVQLLS